MTRRRREEPGQMLLPFIPVTAPLTPEARQEAAAEAVRVLDGEGVAEAGAPVAPELPARVADWPEDWRMNQEERAGIMEFSGGLPREEAERRAEESTRASYAQIMAAVAENPSTPVLAGSESLSHRVGQREAPTGRPEREPGVLEEEWASSGA